MNGSEWYECSRQQATFSNFKKPTWENNFLAVRASALSFIISRGVTSCAGMIAHHVLLAQNKIGFLTGGRSNRFLQLDEGEKDAQRQEAFARAPVPRQSAAVLLRDVPIRYDFFFAGGCLGMSRAERPSVS